VFERFTGESRDVVLRAREESRTLRHPAVGSSHLLLALVDDPGPAGACPVAVGMLAALGVDRGALRTAVEAGRRRSA
jgi:hypothetical protein